VEIAKNCYIVGVGLNWTRTMCIIVFLVPLHLVKR